MRRVEIGGILLAATVAAGCARFHIGGTDHGQEVAAALRAVLQSRQAPAYVTPDAEGKRLWKQTREFYSHRSFAQAWFDGAKPRPQMEALVGAVRAADVEGLDPHLYGVGVIDQLTTEAAKGLLIKKGFAPQQAGAMDVWLTYLYLNYASDLADGLSDLAHADPAWQIQNERFDPRQRLETALKENRVAESLADMMPSNPEYLALRTALATYRGRASQGGWGRLPTGLKLKLGQHSLQVPALARRLSASGDYAGPAPPDGQASEYGAELQEAVKRFERRHGLADDGIVDPGLVAAMNVPIEARIAEIRLNLERWRWLPRDLGARHILVNIPEMRLDVRDNDRVPLSMRVVVGKAETPTPIFNDQMTYLVFSPYWNVPAQIAQEETLPAAMKDPGFLDRTSMEVIDTEGNLVDPAGIDVSTPEKYRFRQRPGADNSLGLVKFMFPNQFNVYLHDTPADSLFARASRSFSHGCVRVEQPQKLAEYVLHDQPEWTTARIEAAMHAGEETSVKLREPMPVYIGYWTARAGPDGLLQFRSDVYGIDARLAARLEGRLQRLRKTAAAAANAALGTTGS